MEVALAVALLALLSLAAAPRFSGLLDRHHVGAAASALVGAHTRARLRAVLDGRPAYLDIRADSLVIAGDSAGHRVPVWTGPGPAGHGVLLGGPTRTLTFSPAGIAMGASNATYTLTRGGAMTQVIVSRLGRVRVQ